ncbi:MAG TPA: hypothetical protein PLJ34_11265 [Hyphomicrobiales bacterium]|nr:hypothetical protein [Hyphomicrobiales bacterium]
MTSSTTTRWICDMPECGETVSAPGAGLPDGWSRLEIAVADGIGEDFSGKADFCRACGQKILLAFGLEREPTPIERAS